ncbi:CPBP family intramembrane glutamic endopeptidase [Roseinatronobacter sp. S2]|uniref:CPBP family intramembrane glutamic endopeptidase n=1 Tax=Roseinatronobacter sp. S2 TaxID=3035471 RepID=UPI0024107D58|nr:CPBP family intramembrane glutamic endopeptidase [Roseinatronobacter sp. S2]WFE75197.1 CPBP family intramembrane metalloprotease [Roseinatronobacter sp. S2]
MKDNVLEPPVGSVFLFFFLTFAIAWGGMGLVFVFQDTVEAALGPMGPTHPLFILAVWAPAISAILLVLWYGGLLGLRRYLSRLLIWRAPVGWYLLLILGIPAVYYFAAFVTGTLTRDSFAQPPLRELLPLVAFMLILGPMEELGWRGYATPVLQRAMAPFWAGLLVGIVWALWHVPAFYLGGTPQSSWEVMPFLLGATAVSIIVTALFNAARGSILLAALFHWQLNMPMWSDTKPLDMYLFIPLAAIVVWIKRADMFSRTGAVTEVMPVSKGRTS